MSGNTLQKAIDLVTKATEEDKNKIEALTNGPVLTLIASLSQTKPKIIN